MSHDNRARRSAVLTTAAKAKPQAKTSAAEQAIRALVGRRDPITFQAGSRETDVSHAFLYTHRDLRDRQQEQRLTINQREGGQHSAGRIPAIMATR